MTVEQDQFQQEFPAPAGFVAEYLRKSISVSYMANLIWSGRLLPIAGALVGLMFGIYSVYSAGPTYLAEMRIMPADSDANSGGQSGGTANFLAGLTGQGATVAVPKFTQFVASIGSIGVARDMDAKYDARCRIFSGDCDQVTHRWRERTGMREWFNGLLAHLGGLPDPNGPRTIVDLATYLRGAITAESNKLNSIVVLSYSNRRPEFAVQLLSQVVSTTNDHIKSQNREVQKRYVDYLSQSAARTTNVEQRQAIDALLLQEERQLMMTEVDIPYAAKILDGPTVTPINKVLKTLVLYTAVGLIIGILVAASRDLLPPSWRRW